MADQHPVEGSTSSNATDGSSDSTVELNVKTLDSQIYNFNVDRNITVSAFKEKIASQIGIPVGQQRLIFRGKVLKDNDLLSEYHVESGHTLHLVERQLSQSQPSSGTTSESTNTNIGSSGQDPNVGGSRNRIGQFSHSVVLGTLNVGDHGEGIVPDLSRVIGAVLSSVGIGNQTGGTLPGVQFTAPVPTPQGNGTGGSRTSTGIQGESGNQSSIGQTSAGPSIPEVVQIPVGAAVAIPSFNAPIPDSLNTLSEYMNRMEQVFARNDAANQISDGSGDLPAVELPSNSNGVASLEGLSTVLRQAERLIGGRAVAALSHIAGRLEREAASPDSTVRGQLQAESVQLGLEMQHIGALFLELGRTILTTRMGQSPAESSVNAGPAVYISPAGPNPIMVQPFPLQTSSLFGNPGSTPINTGVFGPAGTGSIPRHVNIHIHAGTSLTPMVSTVGPRGVNGERSLGERNSSNSSGDSVQTRAVPVRNVIATAIPSQPTSVSFSSQAQSDASAQALAPSSLSSALSELNSRLRDLVDNMPNELRRPSDQLGISSVEGQSAGNGTDEMSSSDGIDVTRLGKVEQTEESHYRTENTESPVNSKEDPSGSSAEVFNNLSCSSEVNVEGTSQSSEGTDNQHFSSTPPLGLGLGGLQPKRRNRQSKAQGKSNNDATSSNQGESRLVGQQVLQSLASLGNNRRNPESVLSGPPPNSTMSVMNCIPAGIQNADGQLDVADAMSQVLQSPALGGLLAGVSQQTGIGSPDALRNMMEQLTQNPAMRNTVNQIAQQIDSHDLGSMFSGMAAGQGGGIDLSRMIQQMMPIVSQALGGSPPAAQSTLMEPQRQQSRPRRDVEPGRDISQIDLHQVAARIEQRSPPQEIFRAMLENAARLNSGGAQDNIVNELCCEEGLVNEFMQRLCHDVTRRLGS